MSKEDWEHNTLPKLFGDLFPKNIHSILDIGTGVAGKMDHIEATVKVGLDAYMPYLEEAKKTVKDKRTVYICANALDLNKLFLPKSFEICILTDILEHLTKADAFMVIRAAEMIATRAVIIETPKGEVKQDMDILGFGGHYWQTHRSAWHEAELREMGYEVFLRPYKMQDVTRHSTEYVDPNITLIDAIKLL